jgi:hypothetical protein
MKALLDHLPIIALCVGGSMVFNGLLHDIFVMISEHRKKYDRYLLRLLVDGHILITCGAKQMVVFRGLEANERWAYCMAGIA